MVHIGSLSHRLQSKYVFHETYAFQINILKPMRFKILIILYYFFIITNQLYVISSLSILLVTIIFSDGFYCII